MNEPVRIDDAGDSRLDPYRAVRERDLVGRQGRFVAEGTVVLRAMLNAGRFAPESVLVLENRLAGLAEILAMLPPETPVYVASQAIMDSVAGFHIHRGVLAVGRRGDLASAELLVAGLPERALVVVLVGISNHDNVGSIFRNAAAFDADAVLLDATSCDPLYRKAIRVSVGAALSVPFARGGDADALVGLLQASGFSVLTLSPSGRDDLARLARPDRVALVLGTEGEGLPRDLLDRTRSVRISMSDRFDSLNVAAASAIALHRLWS
jgi:tRNA G18 (ribose-2'-O)-methylase SpoU